MEKLTQTLFILFALLFAFLGISIILPVQWSFLGPIPASANHPLHLLAAAGLLLAASLSLQCALNPSLRRLQHPLLLAFGTLACLDLSRLGGTLAVVSWVLLALYALPLLQALIPLRHRVGPLQPGQWEGTVKWFNPNKGFGFILMADGREIFVHFKALTEGGRRSLRQGQLVRFTIRDSERGEQADQVVIVG